MILQAEIIYQNEQAFLKLPADIHLNQGQVYVRQDPQTGDLIVSQSQSNWRELWQKLQQIGEIEPLEDVVRTGVVDFRSPLDEI